MILLTGTTGTVGRLVARRLSTDEPVRLLTRRPARVASLARPGIEIVPGDFTDPGSLAAALRGVRAAFLVTADPLTDSHDTHFMTAARHAGVEHVVKLSALAVAEPDATDLITRWQRRNEEIVRESGVAWTFLRPRAFMSNTLAWARSIREEGVVRVLDGTAPNAMLDPRDLADVAVSCLTGAGQGGHAHALTGPAAISPAEQVAVLAEVTGRPLAIASLTESEFRQGLSDRYPAPVAEALAESAFRQRARAKARVDPTVAHLLGRPATAYRVWAEDHRDAFGPA